MYIAIWQTKESDMAIPQTGDSLAHLAPVALIIFILVALGIILLIFAKHKRKNMADAGCKRANLRCGKSKNSRTQQALERIRQSKP
jgi:hypothetical protein